MGNRTEYQKEYYLKNKEKRIEQQKEWRSKNKEQYLESRKNYYKNNKEKLDTKTMEYYHSVKGRYVWYKSCAKRRNILFNLSIEEFKEMWNKPCYYCGDTVDTIGIDRVDSSIGYISSNCRPCCSVCNYMKLDHTEEYFINHIKKILIRQIHN